MTVYLMGVAGFLMWLAALGMSSDDDDRLFAGDPWAITLATLGGMVFFAPWLVAGTIWSIEQYIWLYGEFA